MAIRTGVDAEAGVSLIELMAATAVLTVALFWITTRSIHNVRALSDLTREVETDARGEDVLHAIEKLARGAFAHRPSAWIVEDTADDDSAAFVVDTLRGFPLEGRLLVDPATADREFVGYREIWQASAGRGFVGLTRGQNGTVGRRHGTGTPVRWAAFGEVLDGSPARFDGETTGLTGSVRFLGDATGFCYQRWVDAGRGSERGAVVGGIAVADAFMALEFEAVSELLEAERGQDLNRDGDRTDVFDLGRLRSRAWSTASTPPSGEIRLISPTMLVQESGAWGRADVDGDGDADPMFLWDARAKKLRIRLVMWVAAPGAAREGRFDAIDTVVRL